MHFCCNSLVDFSVFGKVKNCEEKAVTSDSTTKQCTIMDEECCNNRTFLKEGDKNIKKASFELEKETIVFLNVFIQSYVNLFEGLEENIIPFKQYTPPLISKDLSVLHETFLI